jgi:hypothetical protein
MSMATRLGLSDRFEKPACSVAISTAFFDQLPSEKPGAM